MNPNGFEALQIVQAFLRTSVLPAVPASLAGELRAAIKLLATVELELRSLGPLLVEECREIHELCELGAASQDQAAACAELLGRLQQPPHDLALMIELHRDFEKLASRVIAGLQSRPREVTAQGLLRRFYEALGRHAERRLPWQSIFQLNKGKEHVHLT